ncbi:hypothetical protein FKM82_021331 [Ascaphus truei]
MSSGPILRLKYSNSVRCFRFEPTKEERCSVSKYFKKTRIMETFESLPLQASSFIYRGYCILSLILTDLYPFLCIVNATTM